MDNFDMPYFCSNVDSYNMKSIRFLYFDSLVLSYCQLFLRKIHGTIQRWKKSYLQIGKQLLQTIIANKTTFENKQKYNGVINFTKQMILT